jgi:hypothetical protein
VTTDGQAEVFWRSIAAKGAFMSINSGRGVWISLWFGLRLLSPSSTLARLGPPDNLATSDRFVTQRPQKLFAEERCFPRSTFASIADSRVCEARRDCLANT